MLCIYLFILVYGVMFLVIEQLFILGNGFDMAHRLPTGYEDFVDYIKREDAPDDEKTLLDFLIHYIGEPFYDGDFLWKDFENKLGEADFSQDISNTEYREDQLYDDADKDPDYYAYQAIAPLSTIKHIAASLPYIFERWIRTVDIDKAKPIENFRRLIRQNQATFRECKIVCVNRYCMNLLYAPYWGKQR